MSSIHSAVHMSDLTNHRYLSGPVLVDRLQRRVPVSENKQSRQITRLKQRLQDDNELNGCHCYSDETQEDLAQIVQQNANFTDKLPPNQLFCEEQIKALMKSKAKGDLSHPLIIRLNMSLYLHHQHHTVCSILIHFIQCMYMYMA